LDWKLEIGIAVCLQIRFFFSADEVVNVVNNNNLQILFLQLPFLAGVIGIGIGIGGHWAYKYNPKRHL
jgi:hypothetical protein